MAIIDPETGKALTHSDAAKAGQDVGGVLKEMLGIKKREVRSGVSVQGQRSIAFAQPVKYEGKLLGVAFLALSLKPLEAELKKAEERKAKAVSASVRNTLLVGALAIVLGVLLTIMQGVRIARPIRALALQADQIAGGDLQARVQVTSRDEIGVLGDRFNYMAEQVVVLMRETMAKATMEKELEVASAVQATMVPPKPEVVVSGLSLASYFKPATQCGGDWWGYHEMKRGGMMLIVGDVTGHGVASAMITAAAKGAASTVMAMTDGDPDLVGMLKALNVAIHESAKGRFVMTCFASLYDPKTRTLAYSNAGHNFPYVYRPSNRKLMSLVLRGNRLGDVEGSDFNTKEMVLEPGDLVVWYTDGIVEGENAKSEEYGERNFRNEIRRSGDPSPAELRDLLVEKAFAFFGDVPPKDDITLVVGKVV